VDARNARPDHGRRDAKPVTNTAVKIYLVDKPNAAQSVIYLGAPGASASAPIIRRSW